MKKILFLVILASCHSAKNDVPKKDSDLIFLDSAGIVTDTIPSIEPIQLSPDDTIFHINIEANPANEGEVNPGWKNNYVLVYTFDNWKTKDLIKWDAHYEGLDDNGKIYLTATYEVETFQKISTAIQLAKVCLRSKKDVNNYLMFELKMYQKFNKIFTEQNRNLYFKKAEDEIVKPVPIKIY